MVVRLCVIVRCPHTFSEIVFNQVLIQVLQSIVNGEDVLKTQKSSNI